LRWRLPKSFRKKTHWRTKKIQKTVVPAGATKVKSLSKQGRANGKTKNQSKINGETSEGEGNLQLIVKR